MRNFKSSLIVGLMMSSLACSGSKKAAPAEDFSIPEDPRISGSQIELYESAQVFCEGGNCPGYIGEFVSMFSGLDTESGVFHEGLARCTISLIDADTILTNAHCVGNSSAGSMSALFPRTRAFPAERVGIASIVRVSKVALDHSSADYLQLPDYAILKLERPVKRELLKQNTAGVADGMALTKYSATPLSYDASVAPFAKITTSTCVSRKAMAKLPSYTDDRSGVVSLGDCVTVEGESGSPAVNAAGEMVALVQGGTGTESEYIEGHNVDTRLSFATNLACIDFTGSTQLPAACALREDVDQVIKDKYKAADESRLLAQYKAWESQQNDLVQWQPKREIDKDSQVFYIRPEIKCVQPQTKWTTQPATLDSMWNYVGYKMIRFSKPLPIWHYKGTVDSKMRLDLKVIREDILAMNFDFNADDLKSSGPVKGQETITQTGDAPQSESENIPICP